MQTPDLRICDPSRKCIDLFRECATNPILGRWQWIEVSQGDFNFWARGLNVLSHSQDSLDYRIRTRRDILDLILNLLNGLAESLEEALEQGDPNLGTQLSAC